MSNPVRLCSLVAGVLLAGIAAAGPIVVPNTFTAGTPAKAEDVNANFTALANGINTNSQTITSLQTAVNNIPAGPQGPAGPAGPAGPGVMLVQDSAGKTVGSYFMAPYDPYAQSNGFTVPGSTPDEFVFIRTSGPSFAVRVTSAQLGAQVTYDVSFVSTDCTGQAYLTVEPYLPGSLQVAPMLSFAAVLGTTAYIGGTPVTSSSTMYSYLSVSGGAVVCSSWGSNGVTGTFAPVISTFDLSTLGFVPPYSVH